MTKLAILALAFAAMVALAQVSAYKTVITTRTIEDDDFDNTKGRSWQQCSGEVQVQQLSHCQMHLTQGMGPYLRMARGQDAPHLQLCCQQLKNVREECQCEAIQTVFQEAQQQFQRGGSRGWQGKGQGQGQSQQWEQMKWKAEQLPQQCNLDIQQCRIQSSRV